MATAQHTPSIVTDDPACFWTGTYGAFRWSEHLQAANGQWLLVTLNLAFDRMRGVSAPNIECVVDDFGDLVRIA